MSLPRQSAVLLSFHFNLVNSAVSWRNLADARNKVVFFYHSHFMCLFEKAVVNKEIPEGNYGPLSAVVKKGNPKRV